MKMRKTKRQRWDKVGLSRMRNGVGSRLTIGQGSKCIKCERNDNMGDRVIHNLLIILKCLLGRYKIDNLLDEYYSIISEKNRDITKSVAKDSVRCILNDMQEIFDRYGINANFYYCQHQKN